MRKQELINLEGDIIKMQGLSSDDRAKENRFHALRSIIPYRYESTNNGGDLLIYWVIEGQEYFGGNISWACNLNDNIYKLQALIKKFKAELQ